MDFKKIFKNIKLEKVKKMNKNTILMAVAIVCVVVTGVLVFMNLGPSDQSIAKESIDYINNNILQGQGTATLGKVSRESGLIKFEVQISSQSFDSYATKDGKLLFPQAFKLKESTAPADTTNTTN